MQGKQLAAVGLVLSLVACGDPRVGPGIVDLGVDDAPADDGKADYRDLAFDVLPLPTLAAGATPTRRLLVSSGDYQDLFGVEPRGVDFGRDWLVYYSAGDQPTSGHVAEIRGIRLSNDWLSLKVTTAHVSPGTSCRPEATRTRPQILVKLARPLVPTGIVSWLRADEARACPETPPPPPPPPAGRPCGATPCAAGAYCATHTAIPHCLPYRTCALSPPSCGQGTQCVDAPAVCFRPPCPPTAAVCEPFRCPPPGPVDCADKLIVTWASACGGPYHDWIVASCPGVSFIYAQ